MKSALFLSLVAVVAVGCGSASPAPVNHQSTSPTDGTPDEHVEAPPSADAIESHTEASSGTAEQPPGHSPQVVTPQLPTLVDLQDDELRAAGLHVLRFPHWEIVTDLTIEEAEDLATFATDLWSALQATFGGTPQRNATIRAVVVRQPDAIETTSLAGPAGWARSHGRIDGATFWMRAGNDPTYRRHLFAHEAVHVWTTQLTPTDPPASVARLEGIAEWFATHCRSDDRVRFRCLPKRPSDYPGFGRIELLERRDEWPAFETVERFRPQDFREGADAYALVWARELLADRAAVLHPADGDWPLVAAVSQRRWAAVWNWYGEAVGYGVDPAVAAPSFKLLQGAVTARGGWQAAGPLPYEHRVRIRCRGRVSLKPLDAAGRAWSTGPRGIRIDYAGGVPLGCVLAAWCDEKGTWSEPIVVGEQATLAVPADSELFLRVNDDWAAIADNSGVFEVEITEESAAEDQ